jgi:hypothetical protein
MSRPRDRISILCGGVLNMKRETNQKKNRLWVAMLRDPQFWVPIVILIAGLILLSVIQ